LSEAALQEVLEDGQVLAVPSSFEVFGIVYLEGMAFGLPAIAAAAGGAAEIITHGQNGFLVNPEDPQALARRLFELQTDRSRLTRMARSARQRFWEHPTWEDTTGAIRDFIIDTRH
jgi:glycosyltransferase involved in cell wall biosynthesis